MVVVGLIGGGCSKDQESPTCRSRWQGPARLDHQLLKQPGENNKAPCAGPFSSKISEYEKKKEDEKR